MDLLSGIKGIIIFFALFALAMLYFAIAYRNKGKAYTNDPYLKTRYKPKQLLAFGLALIISLIYGHFLNNFKNYYFCLNEQYCQVWGNYFWQLILYSIGSVALFTILINRLINKPLKYKPKKTLWYQLKLPLALIFFLVISVLGFTTYTKTTSNYLEISGIDNFGNQPVRVSWNQVKSFGNKFEKMWTRRTQCVMRSYIILSDDRVIYGNFEDFAFLQYLESRGIPGQLSLSRNCD